MVFEHDLNRPAAPFGVGGAFWGRCGIGELTLTITVSKILLKVHLITLHKKVKNETQLDRCFKIPKVHLTMLTIRQNDPTILHSSSRTTIPTTPSSLHPKN